MTVNHYFLISWMGIDSINHKKIFIIGPDRLKSRDMAIDFLVKLSFGPNENIKFEYHH